MNKKLLCVCALSLLLTGCGEVAKLNITTTEPITIDATEKLDPSIYLKNLDKNATVDYEIKDNELIISVTKGDKTTDFNVPVEVNEPKVSVDRHIEVDKYVGYDLEQYIHEDEGVSHTIDFDEDTGKLSVTFTKGEWTKVIDDDVTVLDSNPINNWPKKYACYSTAGSPVYGTQTFYEDGTWIYKNSYSGSNGTFTFDGKNTFVFDYGDGEVYKVNGNYEHFEQYIATTIAGEDDYKICDLIKE
mgnify:CR=1 FL=1